MIILDKTEGFCHDGHLDCKKWAESGECTKNPAYMYSVCPLSCNICDKEDRCDAVPSSKRISCDATVKEMCYMKGCCWKSGNCFHPSGKTLLDSLILQFLSLYVISLVKDHSHLYLDQRCNLKSLKIIF